MIIDTELLDSITSRAQDSERLRMNYNFHDRLDAPSQRLLNALEPGTLMPVHRHRHTSETYILLRGRMRVTFYDDQRQPIEEHLLDTRSGVYGIQIDKNCWHGLEVLEHGTVIFESKDGPYTPLQEDDILS